MMVLHLLFFIEVVCFLAGCLFWRKQWPLQYKMLVLLMGLTVLVELAGRILGIRYHQNVWLYNLFLPLESASYICFFYLESAHPAMKWLYRCLLAAIVPALVITWLKQPHFFIFNQYGYIAGLFLLLVAAALIYLAEIPHLYLEIVNTIANIFLYGGVTGCFFTASQPAKFTTL